MIEDLLEVWNFTKSSVIDRNRADSNLLKVWNFLQKKFWWIEIEMVEDLLNILKLCNRQELCWLRSIKILKFWLKIFYWDKLRLKHETIREQIFHYRLLYTLMQIK